MCDAVGPDDRSADPISSSVQCDNDVITYAKVTGIAVDAPPAVTIGLSFLCAAPGTTVRPAEAYDDATAAIAVDILAGTQVVIPSTGTSL